MRAASLLTLMMLARAGSAWADHPGGALSNPAMHPVVAAVLWAALAFAVALVVIIIVLLFTRRPESES